MKTTIDMAEALIEEARVVAAREGTTLRALVEEGLRLALARRSEDHTYTLPDLSFGGQGLQAPFDTEGWEAVRSAIYEGRGQ